MKKKNAATEKNRGGVLLESHGFAKRTVVSFSALSLLWIAAAAFYLVCLIAAPSYHEYRAEDPNFFSEEEESLFAIPSSLSEMERLQYAVSVIVAGAVGIFGLITVRDGRRLYLKVYRNCVEGCSGFSIMANKVQIPMDMILGASAHKWEIMPHLEIYTMYGRRIRFYMSSQKAAEAEKLIWEIVKGRKKETF